MATHVARAVGRALVAGGVTHVFGVVGSGNFHVTQAMVDDGARFVAARHEGGAATMADAFARVSGRPAVLSVHQGCGLTNAMTGIAEAAKSRTPLIVLAPEAVSLTSNFHVDQEALAQAVGAVSIRVNDVTAAGLEAITALAYARDERRTVVINLPLAVSEVSSGGPGVPSLPPPIPVPPVQDGDLERLAEALSQARRPVFVAGRGARSAAASEALRVLADRCGALLATSAVAKGLFRGDPWCVDVAGGFSSPVAAELIRGADLIVGWGCSLNMWTMRHGRLIAPDAVVVQVDDTAEALGTHRDLTFGVVGDVAATARAALPLVTHTEVAYRTPEVRDRIARELRWRDVTYEDTSGGGRIDPRTLTIALDDLLPHERVVAVDSGNFMGYPSMFLDVPDEQGFCFTQSFQAVGLGLASAIGAALARPDRLPVAALGDGGALMGASELETVVRLGLPMVVVVYNDDAYGAEVHHFVDQPDLSTVTFPETDIAAIGAGFGYEALTVRSVEDLDGVRRWLAGPRARPLLIDAKVVSDEPAWWLAEAFGH